MVRLLVRLPGRSEHTFIGLIKASIYLFLWLNLCCVCIGVSFQYTNDLNQLRKYVSLTNLSEKVLFDEWTNCQNLLSQAYGRNWRCVPHQTERIMEMTGTFQWKRPVDSENKLVPDCQYSISQSARYESDRIIISLQQSKCGFDKVPGGSSFQAVASFGHAVSNCEIVDLFNSTYNILCPYVECEARNILSKNKKSAERLSRESKLSCLNLTVILDYEHFDAFSETKSNEPTMRHIITNSTSYCIGSDDSKCPEKQHFWLHNYGTHDLSDYEWVSNSSYDGSFPLVDNMYKCLQDRKVTLVVDGQLGMMSGLLEDFYVSSFPQGGWKVENIAKQFVLDTADFFGTNIVPACGDGNKHTFIFEFGIFDLRHTPPRNLISNPLTAQTILYKIKWMLEQEKCSNVHLVWVDLPPAHKCIHSLTACVHELDPTWSNNYAINAVNEFFRGSLRNMTTFPNDRLQIISRFEILSSRLLSELFVCNDLFVCKSNDMLQTTSSFRALAAEILSVICTASSVDWHNSYSHVDKFYSVGNNDSELYYYTMKGVRRRIPDQETLVYLLQQTDHDMNSPIASLGQQELRSIPLDISISNYPTRKNGTLVAINPADAICVMDNGYRRPLSKILRSKRTETLFQILGLDHEHVNKLDINDWNIIPVGRNIDSLDELINITEFVHPKAGSEDQKLRDLTKAASKSYMTLVPCLLNGNLLNPNTKVMFPVDAENHYFDLIERTAMFRNQPYHYYALYDGPWIENYWIDAFFDKPLSYFNGMIPLFVQWVDVMLLGDFSHIVKLMREILRPDVLYFTVSQSDIGLGEIQKAHPNILTISAGGYGHIPIPLIKSYMNLTNWPTKFEYATVFFGNMNQHSRPEAFKNMGAAFSKRNLSYKFASYDNDWREKIRVTKFPLAPRGYGRSSFRFSEIVQFGRSPIYVYDDYSWLPYSGTNASIEVYGIQVCNKANMDDLASALANISDDKYSEYGERVMSIRHLFTYEGVIDQIRLFIKDPLGPTGGYLRCSRMPDTMK